MAEPEKLIQLHGGYRRLKSFQVAQLVYGVAVSRRWTGRGRYFANNSNVPIES